jgi:hypothetical protein
MEGPYIKSQLGILTKVSIPETQPINNNGSASIIQCTKLTITEKREHVPGLNLNKLQQFNKHEPQMKTTSIITAISYQNTVICKYMNTIIIKGCRIMHKTFALLVKMRKGVVWPVFSISSTDTTA